MDVAWRETGVARGATGIARRAIGVARRRMAVARRATDCAGERKFVCFSGLVVLSSHFLRAFRAEDTAQDEFEAALREESQTINNRSATTNEQRASLQLTIRDTVRTPAAVPTTLPVLSLDTSVRLQHTIHFVDSATPTKKAKPAGVRGCQIYMKIGARPRRSPRCSTW